MKYAQVIKSWVVIIFYSWSYHLSLQKSTENSVKIEKMYKDKFFDRILLHKLYLKKIQDLSVKVTMWIVYTISIANSKGNDIQSIHVSVNHPMYPYEMSY